MNRTYVVEIWTPETGPGIKFQGIAEHAQQRYARNLPGTNLVFLNNLPKHLKPCIVIHRFSGDDVIESMTLKKTYVIEDDQAPALNARFKEIVAEENK